LTPRGCFSCFSFIAFLLCSFFQTGIKRIDVYRVSDWNQHPFDWRQEWVRAFLILNLSIDRIVYDGYHRKVISWSW
jgi:hypothetical protein